MSEASRRIDAMAGTHETARQTVIRAFHLTRDEVARAGTMRADDPVSSYAGNFALQAEMMAEEREMPAPPETATEIPPHITLGYN